MLNKHVSTSVMDIMEGSKSVWSIHSLTLK